MKFQTLYHYQKLDFESHFSLAKLTLIIISGTYSNLSQIINFNSPKRTISMLVVHFQSLSCKTLTVEQNWGVSAKPQGCRTLCLCVNGKWKGGSRPLIMSYFSLCFLGLTYFQGSGIPELTFTLSQQ